MGRTTIHRAMIVITALVAAACDGSGSGGGGTGGIGGGSGGGGAGGSGGGNVLEPGQCRSSADCMESGASCYAPGESIPCGACYNPPNPCTMDAECAAQDPLTICDRPQCTCGDSECMPGCTSDAACKPEEFCSPGHRCLPDPCAADADCPANFGCDAQALSCARKACSSDAACSGFCVNGQCHPLAGICALPPP